MLDLHRQTMRQSAEIVAAIRDDQWDLPTPCAQWTVRRLLDHMVRENRGFATAANGETSDLSAWIALVGPDRRAEYAESARQVVDAFGADGVLERAFWLPLIRDGVTVPARQGVSFHLLDYLVHSWDLAVSVGRSPAFGDDLVAAVHEIAVREVPDGPRRSRPGASFAPARPVPADAPALDRLLAFLGRDPGFRCGAPR